MGKGQAVGGLVMKKNKVGMMMRSTATEENQEGRGQQGFEGPEKTLEIEFHPDVGHEQGLRAIRKEQWDAILEQVCMFVCMFLYVRMKRLTRQNVVW